MMEKYHEQELNLPLPMPPDIGISLLLWHSPAFPDLKGKSPRGGKVETAVVRHKSFLT